MWNVHLDVATDGGPDRTITLQFTLNRMPLTVPSGGVSGAGWSCADPSGAALGSASSTYIGGSGQVVTCTFDYAGSAPPVLSINAEDAHPNTAPATIHYWAKVQSGSDTNSLSG